MIETLTVSPTFNLSSNAVEPSHLTLGVAVVVSLVLKYQTLPASRSILVAALNLFATITHCSDNPSLKYTGAEKVLIPVVASTVTPLPTLSPPALTVTVFANVDIPATSKPPAVISIPPAVTLIHVSADIIPTESTLVTSS